MKKYSILIFFSLFFFSACENQLDKDPIGLITDDLITTKPTPASIQSGVDASYQLLASTLNIIGNWDWSGGKVLRNDFILGDIASGDMNKKWNPDGDQAWIDEVASFNFTSMNGAFNGIWAYDYEGISRVNASIATLEDDQIMGSIDVSPANRSRMLGESYFLRAFYYFDLVNNFGGVPLLTKPLENFNQAYEVTARATEEEVYKQIKADLEKAVANLPNAKYASETDKWRASKGAAQALLAKVALYNTDWSSVISLVNELETWGFYSLNDRYFDAFDATKKFQENEVIFAYNHLSGQNPSKGNGIAALTGWGFVAPTESFKLAFEENDPRLGYTIDVEKQFQNKILGTTDGTYKGNDDSPANKVYIRYADVKLWKAEALIRLNEIADGMKIINEIRSRARSNNHVNGTATPATALPNRALSGLSQTQAMDFLAHERRVELGWESQRLNDLKRWGKAKEFLSSLGKNFQDNNYLYPIPQGEIDKSGGRITQNPGY